MSNTRHIPSCCTVVVSDQDVHGAHTLYKSTDILGEGAYGRVFNAIKIKNGIEKDYSKLSKGKIIKAAYIKSNNQLKNLKKECEMTRDSLMDGKTRGVIGPVPHHVDANGLGTYCVVMPKAPGIEFYEYLENDWYNQLRQAALHRPEVRATYLAEADLICLYFLKAAADQIENCHLVHRDIKPENVMFDVMKKKFTFIDFGFAKRDDVEKDPTILGSAIFISPEMLTDRISTHQSDQYALGKVIAIVYGFVPDTMGIVNPQCSTEITTRGDAQYRDLYLQLINLSDERAALFQQMTKLKPEQRFKDLQAVIAQLEKMIEAERNTNAHYKARYDQCVTDAERARYASKIENNIIKFEKQVSKQQHSRPLTHTHATLFRSLSCQLQCEAASGNVHGINDAMRSLALV